MNERLLEPGIDISRWRRRLRVAQGSEPADLVLTGGTVVNVFSGELIRADVAVADGHIAGIGRFPIAHSRVDASDSFVAPSFIDAHIHLESALVWPTEFARAVVPHGTGLVIADPHEIANVVGLAGIEALRDAVKGLPMHVRFTVPSCVPASDLESSGARLDAAEIAAALAWPEVVGLGEVMDVPGVLSGSDAIGAKLAATSDRRDGHAPGLSGPALQAYAGSEIDSDHESTELEEAREKLRAGMMLMIREGSSERNLRELLPLVDNNTYPRCCFASDDRDCHTLLNDGHIDETLRRAVGSGLDPVRAIRLATWNAADYWRLPRLGAVAPGYEANLVLLRDLVSFEVAATIFRGRTVAQDGECKIESLAPVIPQFLMRTMNPAAVRLRDLALHPDAATVAVDVVPGQIVTRRIDVDPRVVNGVAVADPERDLLKLVCVERHHATGRVGVGYVRGFGLRNGALASTIAHDAHNIVAVGADDVDILAAIATVVESGGGLAAVAHGQVIGHLPLPIAGLLSDRPLVEVADGYAALEAAARGLGSKLPSPFGLLAFMALSVIPAARVTDRGFQQV